MTANLREATENSILVLGAGELGMAVLRGLARRSAQAARITVLLRCSTIASSEPENRKKNR
jgi:saccharopine dehydrogenase-like NADP-dependent oxidoreductase